MKTKKIQSFALELILLTGLVFFLMGLLIFPQDTSASCTEGIYLCINAVFPSLFPFFVLSTLVIDTGIVERIALLLSPISRFIFGISGKGFSAFLLGILGGYPVGAKTAVSLYENKLCSKEETQRLLCFCNNSGPAFILGVVGISVFGSFKIGILLYLSHILAAIILGIALKLIFGNVPSNEMRGTPKMQKSFSASFINAVTSGMTTMLSVCAFVIFFGVFITVLTKSGILLTISNAITKIFGPFLADNGLLQGLITGFFEMTNGIMNLQSGDFYGSVTVAALLLGWAGMSVHFQTMTFISKAGLSSKNYFLGKLCQGFISMSLMWLYFRFVPISREIFYYEYPYWYGYELGFSNRFWMANLICTAVFALFTLLAYFSIEFFTEKRYNKKRKRKGEDKCFTEKE